jgi:hypothetical protein
MCILIGKMELPSKFSLVKNDVPVQRKYVNIFTHCQLSIPSFLEQNVLERYGSGGGYLGNLCHFLFILLSEWVLTPSGPVGGYQCSRVTY